MKGVCRVLFSVWGGTGGQELGSNGGGGLHTREI